MNRYVCTAVFQVGEKNPARCTERRVFTEVNIDDATASLQAAVGVLLDKGTPGTRVVRFEIEEVLTGVGPVDFPLPSCHG